MPEAQNQTDYVSARNLSSFQQNILAILSEEAMYGLAIKRRLQDYYESEINHGRLYPNLDQLVEEGFIEKSQLDKRTNQYTLTDDGYDTIVDTLGWAFSKFITDDNRAETVLDLVADQQ